MRMISLVTAGALVLAAAGSAMAQTPSPIGKYSAWGAYSYNSGGGKVCYVLTIPQTKKPDKVDHGDNFFLVSQKPGQNVAYEPQFMAAMKAGKSMSISATSKRGTATAYTYSLSGISKALDAVKTCK